jgi:mannose-6-phosphate isomerase-like protein (cupin superfamily)
MSSPKTIFCDIDGTLVEHTGDIIKNYSTPLNVLPHVLENIKQWDKLNYRIILTTGRQESVRKATEEALWEAGIVYSQLIMGIPNGDRVLINDRKTRGNRNTAYAINLVRNQGMSNVDISSENVTIPDKLLFTKVEKPWGYEELVECNDKYVVKKLFMTKGNSCSIQYHELKTETIVVLWGRLNIYIGDTLESLEKTEYNMGDMITIKPYTVHRMEAVADSLYIETSTNELWDVVRLKDNYGRA